MSYYLDIHLLPDPELAPHHVMTALYGRLHRALVQLVSRDIGVSFPDHDDRKPQLGGHLRLHSSEGSLETLMTTAWLNGIGDHLRVSPIAVAPSGVQYRVVSRAQAKSSPERLRRRAMKRHGLDEAEARQRIPDSAAGRLRLPFLTLGSRSTGQASFPLFIRHGPLLAEPVLGGFNTYGLSQTATVAWF